LERSKELASDAYLRIDGGEPIDDVAAWLASRDDIVRVKPGKDALWFRLDRGRPHWVLAQTAFSSIPAGSPPPRELQSKRAASVAGASRPSDKDVVGDDPQKKRVLILSPYAWEFQQWDDGPTVAALFSNARGYENGVVFHANASNDAQTVTNADFRSFGAYDVIHVSTHGEQVCGDDGCDTVLLLGDSGGAVELGNTLVTSATLDYGADADFFRAAYPQGLSKKLIFLSACETTKQLDFASLFGAPSSVYLGWTETVGSDIAFDAAFVFYSEAINNGRRGGKAYDAVRREGFDVDPRTGARLQGWRNKDDLRVREVITAYDPSSTLANETELEDGDAVSVEGVPGDGRADQMPFVVHVQGVEPDDKRSDYRVHISVDGSEATRTWTLEEASKIDTYSYRLEGVAPFSVDFDDSRQLDVEFWVELPEGGESRQRLMLTSASWTLRYNGPYLAGTYTGSVAELALRNAFGIGSILIFETGDVDQEPEVRINTTWLAPIMSGENVFELRAPPSPAGLDDLEGTAISVITFRDVVDDGMGTVADSGVVNGDGVTTVIQPDDSIYTSPSPPTLTLFDYDPNAPTVRGTIEGPYGVCYGFIDLGPQGFCDTYDVSIDFSAVQEIAGP